MIGSEGAHAGVRCTSTVASGAIKGALRIGRLLAPVVMAFAAGGIAVAGDADRSTPSGLPVPRYVSLKVDPAFARSGPSEDHRVLWVYHARGLPVQVVAENQFWRRICDPEGSLVWVHTRVIDGRRTVMQTNKTNIPLRASPKPNARIRAYMVPRSIGALDRCSDGWCKVKVGSVEGWAPEGALWGTATAPQCRQAGIAQQR